MLHYIPGRLNLEPGHGVVGIFRARPRGSDARNGVVKRQTNPALFFVPLPCHSSILSISTLFASVLWLFGCTSVLCASPAFQAVEAKIDRPHTGEHLGGKVNIFGRASGKLFKEYRLEYRPILTGQEANNSTGWRQIGGRSTSPVVGTGFLGQWDAQRVRGEFLIRLVVVSAQSEEVQDRIHLFIENERPHLEIANPSEGLLTAQTQITLRGTTETSNTVVIKSEQNEISLPVDSEGHFIAQLSLSEGTNRIEIQAKNPIGLETNLIRTVVRDSQPPEIALTSPPDFALIEVPYVTVSGRIDDLHAQLLINETAVPLKADGRFERTLLLQAEVTNPIRVVAIDRLGRKTTLQRRISYKKQAVFLGIDLNPPVITEVLPPDGASLDRSYAKITGFLVDDVEIDPRTIRFSFGGETFIFDGSPGSAKFDGNRFDFLTETGRFTYSPPAELIDGTYQFKLEVQDTAGNSAAPIDSTFRVDTRPFRASISAERLEAGNHTLRITLTTTERLDTIPVLEILPSGAKLGYTPRLNQFGVGDGGVNTDLNVVNQQSIFQYAVDFPISLSQMGFTLSTQIRSLSGEVLSVRGYFTDQNRLFEDIQFPRFILGAETLSQVILLSIDGGPSVLLPESDVTPQVALKSQGGSDQNTIHVQRQNAKTRGLTILEPVYAIESLVETEAVSFQIALPLPLEQNKVGNRVAMFWWDSQFQQWRPLHPIKNRPGMLEATAERFGNYALLVDRVPPVINAVFPEELAQVQRERFLILYEITDEGAGVDTIQAWVDDRAVQFFYEAATGRLTYLPSNLEGGRHTLEIRATDRAGNQARQAMDFFSQNIFDFADQVTVYPNPASREATITFRLTKSADVALEIYDVTGNLLYTDVLHNVVGQQSASLDEAFVWQCENQVGEPVVSGIYIYVLEARREEQIVRQSGKVAVVR